jgi:hypothetical protein
MHAADESGSSGMSARVQRPFVRRSDARDRLTGGSRAWRPAFALRPNVLGYSVSSAALEREGVPSAVAVG